MAAEMQAQLNTWQIYHDALCTLNESPSRGMVSPSLMGSHGTIPLTIISTYVSPVRRIE